jgi:hypothetical protein
MQESQDYSGDGTHGEVAGTLSKRDNLDHVINVRRPHPAQFAHSLRFHDTAINDARDSHRGAKLLIDRQTGHPEIPARFVEEWVERGPACVGRKTLARHARWGGTSQIDG